MTTDSSDSSGSGAQDRELADAIARYVELERAGAAPSTAEFAREHPAVESQLRACLDVLVQLRGEHQVATDVPTVLGDFAIRGVLGRGGMGIVYDAEQKSLPRRVALKVLAQGLGGDAGRLARFRREIETTARLRHPSIVPVLEAGAVGGLPYYAMPLLEGESLERSLARWRADPRHAPLSSRAELVAWIQRFIDVALALETAHRAGVVHRDIKPSNLFLESSGRLVVLDFGLTRSSSLEGTTLTTAPVGTPRYMSPEQILARSGSIDGRTDQFSLAATFYELLTLEPAFPGGDREAVFRAILASDPVSLRARDARVPRDIDVIVLRALEKEPERRFASCAELADDLQRFLDYEPVHARPLGPIGKLARRARRNPVAAVALAVASLAVVAVPLRSAVNARDRQRAMVASELDAGQAERRQLSALRARIHELEVELRGKTRSVLPWAPLEQRAPMAELGDELDAARRGADRAFRDGLAHLIAAQRIAPEDVEVGRAISALALDEYGEAQRRRESDRLDDLRQLALAYDPHAFDAASFRAGTVSIATDPPGARVFLFRFEDKGPLRLAVPVSAAGEIDRAWLAQADVRGPWTWIDLTAVERGGGMLQSGDAVFAVCGCPLREAAQLTQHVSTVHPQKPDAKHVVEIWRGDRLGVAMLDPGTSLKLNGELVARPALPVQCAPSAAMGASPLAEFALPIGCYLAVLQRDGVEVRAPFEVRGGERTALDVSLAEASVLGGDFVYVPAARGPLGGDVRAIEPFDVSEVELPAFFVQRREVTVREYFEFLAALETTDSNRAAKHAPRQMRGAVSGAGAMWDRDGDGHIRPLPEVNPDWPIVGVSFRDAQAYCAWLNASSPERRVEYALPTEFEWERAARGVDGRKFAWGDGFEWRFARLGSTAQFGGLLPGECYAADVTLYGACDMNGNVREWCDADLGVLDREILRGAAWSTVVENEAHLASRGATKEADYVDTISGFRVVAHARH